MSNRTGGPVPMAATDRRPQRRAAIAGTPTLADRRGPAERALKPSRALLAAALAALTGYVDALGYLALSGFFVSFMSGNSTRLAIGLRTDARIVATAGGLVGLFVVGVMLGTIVGRRWTTRRAAAVLLCVAACLVAGAVGAHLGHPTFALACMTLAMGAESVALDREGAPSVAVTYVTGALVKLGQRLVTAFAGGPRWDWAWHAVLWVGLVAGAGLGAMAYPALGLDALWIAAVVAVGLSIVARGVDG